jgi:hypothetical protein
MFNRESLLAIRPERRVFERCVNLLLNEPHRFSKFLGIKLVADAEHSIDLIARAQVAQLHHSV